MIVYTPIDLPCKIPDRKKLTDYVLSNYIENLSYTSMLCAVASRNPIKNWRDADEVFPDYDREYDLRDDPKVYYSPGLEENFPEIVEVLSILPYKQVIGAALNMHTNLLYSHQDDKDPTGASSPERYNVLLTPHYEQDSFFISKNKNGEKIYPKVLKDAPIYAFNNKDIYHGADIVLDNRIILVCAGIIDHDNHEELIERSVKKYEDYAIRFEDL